MLKIPHLKARTVSQIQLLEDTTLSSQPIQTKDSRSICLIHKYMYYEKFDEDYNNIVPTHIILVSIQNSKRNTHINRRR